MKESKECFNALNGLLSFLPIQEMLKNVVNLFQRPERASLISTEKELSRCTPNERFQRPERASFISTHEFVEDEEPEEKMFQRPERASFISTG